MFKVQVVIVHLMYLESGENVIDQQRNLSETS